MRALAADLRLPHGLALLLGPFLAVLMYASTLDGSFLSDDFLLSLMLDKTSANPRVLDEPQHRIWFKGFGEYRLEFEIWVFTNISFGFATMTALYTQIYKRLQEAGIEIPVPRRDVHVHGEGRFPTAESMPGSDASMLAE